MNRLLGRIRCLLTDHDWRLFVGPTGLGCTRCGRHL